MKTLDIIEITGAVLRIGAFGALSLFGQSATILFVWITNCIAALALGYETYKMKNKGNINLNAFWLIIGLIGIYNSIK